MILRQSKQELLGESLKDLLREEPLEKITVQNIADNCQLSRTTFYRYFKDKYELMNWIYFHEIQSFLDCNPQISSWRQLLHVVTAFLQDNCTFFQAIINFKGQNSFEEFLFNYGTEYCFTQIRSCTGEEQINTEETVAVTLYVGGTMRVLFDWLRSGCPESADQMAEIMSGCMPHPLDKYFTSELQES